MAVGDGLDFTPRPTMSTIQTPDETANVVINSLLIVFILININSAVSKLIHLTRNATFNYNSWLRGFIFASSDDPLRILSWLRRRYVYRESDWNRYPNTLRKRRLALPLLARMFVLLVSIVSIAITIPRDKILSGCSRGDYKIHFDEADADPNDTFNSICTEIPLMSNRGEANATASHCACPSKITLPRPDLKTAVLATDILSYESLDISMVFGDKGAATLFYVEWRRGDIPDKSYRSELSKVISEQKLYELVFAWFTEDNPDCDIIENDTIKHFASWSCPFVDIENTSRRIYSRLRSSIRWERTENIQPRLELKDVLLEPSPTNRITECVVPIIVTRPIVNMVPLAIMLTVWIAINAAISFIASKHNNVLDAGFHIVKEALGHDTTSNPLEQCKETDGIVELQLRKWRCGGGGAHVGFIGRAGDVAVERFSEEELVCGCAVVGTELERARTLRTAPLTFVDPNRSPGGWIANV